MNHDFEQPSVFDKTLLAGGPMPLVTSSFQSLFCAREEDQIHWGGVLRILRQVIDEGHMVLQGLRSPHPPSTNLEKAFAALLKEIGPAYTSRIRVVVMGQPRPLKQAIQEQIYRIGREAIVHALCHSDATSIEVELEYLRHQISLVVRDNGCGIEQKLLKSRPELHCRLSGMSERARDMGAQFQIWSKPGAGTELKLSLPIASESGSAA